MVNKFGESLKSFSNLLPLRLASYSEFFLDGFRWFGPMMRFVIHWGYGLRLDSVIIMTDGQLWDTILEWGAIFL